MAARVVPSIESKNRFRSLTMALTSAVLEWLLMVMLIVDAIFSYLITQFAHHCKLQVPCLLCSRLDHVWGRKRRGFYWDLICGHHKVEISSLVLCHGHNKLGDVHGMCEGCLFSFATINKSNAETYRLLAGKLGADSQPGHDTLLKDQNLSDMSTRSCTCCKELLVSRNHGYKLLRAMSAGSEIPDSDVPLSDASPRDFDDLKEISEESSKPLGAAIVGKNDFDPMFHVEYEKVKITSDTESDVPDKPVFAEISDSDVPLFVASPRDLDDLKEISEESYKPVRSAIVGKNDFDPLSHIEYEKVKITSDTESDVPYSEDDFGSPLIGESSGLKKNFSVGVLMEADSTTASDDWISEKLIHPDFGHDQVLLNSQPQFGSSGLSDSKSLTSAPGIGHGLEELSWSQVDRNIDAASTLISEFSNDLHQTSDITEPPTEESIVLCEVEHNIGTNDAEDACKKELSEAGDKSVAGSETSAEMKPVLVDSNSLMPSNLELGDAYKLAVGSKARQLSGKFLSQMSLKDSTKVSEDLKLLLSQLSFTRGIEYPFNDMSPRVPRTTDELTTDSPRFVGLHILQKRISLERNESGLSLDGSFVSEIEGESEIERLRRQVEHDRKLLSALYKELEEERSASTVAANQAMAMITKLQEEKAALHMEALQCLREMEEQAEYDEEALLKANELLVQKEKETQDLEAELELVRSKYGNALILGKEMESTCDLKTRDVRKEHLDTCNSKNSDSVQRKSVAMNSLLDFEDEKFILQCLRKLEKKLDLFDNDGDDSDVILDESIVEDDKLSYPKETIHKGDESVAEEENSSPRRKPVTSSENLCAQEGNAPVASGPDYVSKESNEFDCKQKFYPRGCRLTEVAALGDAVSNLIAKLEALEGDHKGSILDSPKIEVEDVKISSEDM